jgi:hypothetical protein
MFIVKYYEFCEQNDISVIIKENIYDFCSLIEAKQFITLNFNKLFKLDFLNEELENRLEEEIYINIFETLFFYKIVLEKKMIY